MKPIHVARRLVHLTSKTKFEATKKPRCVLNPCKCQMVPCCMRSVHPYNYNYGTGPCLLPDVDDDIWNKVMKYSKYRPMPLSIETFLHHGQHSSREVSYRFLRQEIPTRLAGLLLEFNLLPSILQKQAMVTNVRDDHLQTFQELLEFPDKPSETILEKFDETLATIRQRHADTVSQLAEAVMETKFELEESKQDVDSGIEAAIQYFLDRLYMTRISTRMLYNQHLYIHGDNIAKPRHVGQIDPYCDVANSVTRAYEEAAKLCDLHYGEHPEVQINSFNKTISESENVPILFAYVPSHLHHMVFEVIKNSMRATIEHSKMIGSSTTTPIKVLISKTDVDITIKISDCGGGIPRSMMGNLFKYMYTTAGRVGRAHVDMVKNSDIPPMAGLGYGLPLSRLYARYFQGDLDISSIHGVGTDCSIYLRSMEANAPEQIPIYTLMTSKNYRDKVLEHADDWTGTRDNTNDNDNKDNEESK